jgi:hypothetical protein
LTCRADRKRRYRESEIPTMRSSPSPPSAHNDRSAFWAKRGNEAFYTSDASERQMLMDKRLRPELNGQTRKGETAGTIAVPRRRTR